MQLITHVYREVVIYEALGRKQAELGIGQN